MSIKSPKSVLIIASIAIIMMLIIVSFIAYSLGKQSGEDEYEVKIAQLESELKEKNDDQGGEVDNQDDVELSDEKDETQEEDESADESVEIKESNRYLFRSALNKTTFQYPRDWVVTSIVGETTEFVENPRTYYVTSPSGSRLIYFEANYLVPFGIEYGCDESDPTGASAVNLFSCEFIGNSENRFARYKDLELNIDVGEWFVAEKQSEGTYYVSPPGDNFKYSVKDSNDLVTLDEIMLSVERTD